MNENQKLKLYMRGKGVPQYKVANHLGICEMTLQRRLRKQLSDEEIQTIKNAVDEIVADENIDN